jgi:hypothetical protein
MQPQRKHDSKDSLVIISLNILSQKLVDGELPSYKWLYRDDEKRKDYLNERFRLFKKFLEKVKTQTGGSPIHILNMQEIVCQEDYQLIQRITDYLNMEDDDYILEVAREATGAQGLKVATIFKKSLQKQGDTGDLLYKKGDKSIQFGLIQHFRMEPNG